jgi:hypothetical protein
MLRKLSCGAAAAGLALLLAAPAFGKGRPLPPDMIERAVSAERSVTQDAIAFPPDAIERAVSAQRPVTAQGSVTERVIDDHFRYDPAVLSKQAPTARSSGNEVEWPEPGFGFGLALGILLMLGVGLGMRYVRARQPAH